MTPLRQNDRPYSWLQLTESYDTPTFNINRGYCNNLCNNLCALLDRDQDKNQLQ